MVTDEVYEHLVYDGAHMPIASLPGMRDRTVTISSGGKTFSFTGWKVGWICAAPALTDAVRTVKQFLTYVNAGPFQYAIAVRPESADDYFTSLAADMRDKRDRLCPGSSKPGSRCIVPQGTYFVTTDIRPLGARRRSPVLPRSARTVRCGRGLRARCFYDDKAAGAPLVRWACSSVPKCSTRRSAARDTRPMRIPA